MASWIYPLIGHVEERASGLGNKAEVMARQFAAEFPKIQFIPVAKFVAGPTDTVNVVWQERIVRPEELFQDGDFVVICVDNFKTRATICQYCEAALQNVKVLNLGNKDGKGHGILYVRRGGRDIKQFPPITKEHPEILKGTDRAPHEKSCEELAQSDPQVPLENRYAALTGLYMICAEMNRTLKHNEYWFDITQSGAGMMVPQPKWESYKEMLGQKN